MSTSQKVSATITISVLFLLVASVSLLFINSDKTGHAGFIPLDDLPDTLPNIFAVDASQASSFTIGDQHATITALEEFTRIDLLSANGMHATSYHYLNGQRDALLQLSADEEETRTVDVRNIPSKQRERELLSEQFHKYTGKVENVLYKQNILEKKGYVDDEKIPVIITFKKQSTEPTPQEFRSARDKVMAQLREDRPKELSLINAIATEVTADELAALNDNPDVARVSLDKKVSIVLSESVPQIKADLAWQRSDSEGQSLTGQGVSIAILDTGIDYTHPDLGGCLGEGCKVAGGYDFINDDSDPMDDQGHGTHVAATAAGKQLILTEPEDPVIDLPANVVCFNDSNCPSFETEPFCGTSNSVCRNVSSALCVNPGTELSFCSETWQLICDECPHGCELGVCVEEKKEEEEEEEEEVIEEPVPEQADDSIFGIQTRTNRVNLYEEVSSVVSEITQEDLPNLLPGEFEGQTIATYTQILDAPEGEAVFSDVDTYSEDPAYYLNTQKQFGILVDLDGATTSDIVDSHLVDFEGSKINILNTPFTIYEATFTGPIRFKFVKDPFVRNLQGGETHATTYNRERVEIRAGQIAQDNKVQICVNDECSPSLSEYETFHFTHGLSVAINDVNHQENNVGIYLTTDTLELEYEIGSQGAILSPVIHSGTTIEDSSVSFGYSTGAERIVTFTRIEINLEVEDLTIQNGGRITDAFHAHDLSSTADFLKIFNYEVIFFSPATPIDRDFVELDVTDNELVLSFDNKNEIRYSPIILHYSDSGEGPFFGEQDRGLANVEGEQVCDEGLFIVENAETTRVLKLKNIQDTPESQWVKIQDIEGDSLQYDFDPETRIADIALDGYTYQVQAEESEDPQCITLIDITDDVDKQADIFTKNGLEITLNTCGADQCTGEILTFTEPTQEDSSAIDKFSIATSYVDGNIVLEDRGILFAQYPFITLDSNSDIKQTSTKYGTHISKSEDWTIVFPDREIVNSVAMIIEGYTSPHFSGSSGGGGGGSKPRALSEEELQTTNNLEPGLHGVAPDAILYGYKVLDEEGSGAFSGIIAAIERSMDPNQDGDTSDHHDIISMSLGGSGHPDDELSLAVDRATEIGIISVVAAGNSGPWAGSVGSPGTARTALTVAASCKESEIGNSDTCEQPIATFSSRGPTSLGTIKPEISAPGVNICAAQSSQDSIWQRILDRRGEDVHCVDTSHISISGTSMATPHVSGVAALLLQDNPDLSPEDIKSKIMLSANDLALDGVSLDILTQGVGEVDTLGALDMDLATSPQIISLGYLNENQVSTPLILKNIGSESFSVAINPQPVTDELGAVHNLVSASQPTVQIEPGAEISVDILINIPSDAEGEFEGVIALEAFGKTFNVPIQFIRLSRLTVTVVGDQDMYPDIFIHNEDLSKGDLTFQSEIDGNSYTFDVRSGLSSAYAVGDSIDLKNEYILMDTIDVPIHSEVEIVLDKRDATPITVNAESKEGKRLKLYKWEKGIYIYDKLGRNMTFNFIDPDEGNREIYVSDKPDNGMTIDLIFNYHGIPSENEHSFGGRSKSGGLPRP